MQNLLTVASSSEKIGVSPDTIRRWEKKGLIKGTRSENNYRLFNLGEIERIHEKVFGGSKVNNYKILKSKKSTQYTVVELFAGAGGTALGMENAGLQHLLLIDNDKNSASTLKKNMPGWNVHMGDVREYSFKGIKADIVQGGFPCQAFSYAGKKMGFEDIRGTMFFEFARCVKEIKPKIAIGENVKGLLNHDNGRTLKTMVTVLSDLGY